MSTYERILIKPGYNKSHAEINQESIHCVIELAFEVATWKINEALEIIGRKNGN